jgi:hypothetical protein
MYCWVHKALTNKDQYNWEVYGSYRCGRGEMLHHILSTCKLTISVYTKRHNAVLGYLEMAAHLDPKATVYKNKVSPKLTTNQHPDLIIINDKVKKIVILDVMITSQYPGRLVEKR